MLNARGILVHPHEFDRVWVDSARALGLNRLGLHPVGGENAAQSLQDLLDRRAQLMPIMDYAHENGLAVEYEMHALSWLLPRSLFAAHPD